MLRVVPITKSAKLSINKINPNKSQGSTLLYPSLAFESLPTSLPWLIDHSSGLGGQHLKTFKNMDCIVQMCNHRVTSVFLKALVRVVSCRPIASQWPLRSHYGTVREGWLISERL